MDSKPLTFGYWAGFRGLAEPIRLILEYTGVKYEEKFYFSDKASEWIEGDKLTLGLDFPNLPYFIDGSENITESEACLLHTILKSNKTDLLGKDAKAQVTVATLKGVTWDLWYDLTREIVFHKDWEKTKENALKTKIHPRLENLDKFLGDKKYFLGYLTVADFKIYGILKILDGFGEGLLDKYSNLKKFIITFEEIDELQTYLKSDRNKKKDVFPPGAVAWKSFF